MSKFMERVAFGKTIAIPGVTVSKTAMVFARVDEETLAAAGAFLQAVDASAAWWWGDYMAAFCGYNLKRDEAAEGAASDELSRQDREKQYTSRYSEVCGREAKTLKHWKGVAEFYDSSRRRDELSWSHHIEAKEGSDGDKAVADDWLDKAEKEGWSHAELRAAIRRSKRAAQEPEEPLPQLVLPMEVVECRRYATAAIKRVGSMDAEEARALLAELGPVLALATALAARVAATDQQYAA